MTCPMCGHPSYGASRLGCLHVDLRKHGAVCGCADPWHEEEHDG